MKIPVLLASCMGIVGILAGCTHAPVAPESNAPAAFAGEPLEIAPALQHYRRFTVVALGSSRTESGERQGRLAFNPDSAAMDLYDTSDAYLGRLFIAPEVCRNDDSPDCVRHYAMSGQLTESAGSLRCYVQIRNDTNTGYLGQALTGICRDNTARRFEIKLYGEGS